MNLNCITIFFFHVLCTGEIYELGVSAQSVGTTRRIDTPSQVLYVQVEDINPQFYLQPYIIDISETSQPNDR